MISVGVVVDSGVVDIVRSTEQEALVNLRVVLELVAAGHLRCSDKTLRPSAATVGLIASRMACGDFYPDEPIAAFAWPLLVQAGGLATIAGGKLQLTAKGLAALRKPTVDVIAGLWRRWPRYAGIDEFSRVDRIKGQRAKNVLTAAATRRTRVAAALEACVPDEWITVDALFAAMRRHGLSPDIARSDRAQWKLYLVDPQYGSMGYAGYGDWPVLEGRYTLAVLFEYAATLGLIDVDYTDPAGARTDYHEQWGADDLEYLSRYDGLRSIRRNALGRYAVGAADRYVPVAETVVSRPLTALPNRDIVAGGEVSAADRLTLSAYAERVGDRVWTVTSDSLLGALDGGHSLADFTEFLTARVDKGLPEVLTVLFADVDRQAGRLADLGSVRLVECADPATTALLAGDRSLRGLCRPVGDRHLAVAPEQLEKFRARLRALGHVLPGAR